MYAVVFEVVGVNENSSPNWLMKHGVSTPLRWILIFLLLIDFATQQTFVDFHKWGQDMLNLSIMNIMRPPWLKLLKRYASENIAILVLSRWSDGNVVWLLFSLTNLIICFLNVGYGSIYNLGAHVWNLKTNILSSDICKPIQLSDDTS